MKQWLAGVLGGKPTITTQQIREINLAAAIVLAGQAVAVLLFSGTYTLPVYVSFLANDSLQSKLQNHTVLAPGIHEVAQINLAYIVAAMLLVTAIVYLVVATVWRRQYEGWLKKRVQPLRWVIVAVAGSLLVGVLALLAGVQQLDSLKLIALLMVIAAIGLWQLELQPGRRNISMVTWAGLAITLIAVLAPAVIIMLALLFSAVFGSAPAASTLWLVVTVCIGWTLFAINAHLHRFVAGKWTNYLFAECGATLLIVLIETVFTWQLFAAVLKP